MDDTDCCNTKCPEFDITYKGKCRVFAAGAKAPFCVDFESEPKGLLDEDTEELNNPFDYQVDGSHYKKEGLMDVTEWCMRHDVPLAEFNVIKYTFRHKKKNGIIDLRKAKHYLEFIAYIKYGENL